jgi:hypothetical protein
MTTLGGLFRDILIELNDGQLLIIERARKNVGRAAITVDGTMPLPLLHVTDLRSDGSFTVQPLPDGNLEARLL